ncbi:uncharacterized protein C8Q71DRAFT_885618, partial [Rhodofomes roseus]
MSTSTPSARARHSPGSRSRRILRASSFPPRPDHWNVQAGWTRYLYHPDGSSSYEHAEYPDFNGQAEEMLMFDVEALPAYSPYAVMA